MVAIGGLFRMFMLSAVVTAHGPRRCNVNRCDI